MATLAGFYFVLISLATIPEGVLFDVIKVGEAPWIMARQLGIALIMAFTITALFQRPKQHWRNAGYGRRHDSSGLALETCGGRRGNLLVLPRILMFAY